MQIFRSNSLKSSLCLKKCLVYLYNRLAKNAKPNILNLFNDKENGQTVCLTH